MSHLTAEELDTVVQNLAQWGDLWGFGDYTEFSITPSRVGVFAGEELVGLKAVYAIFFPKKIWNKIRLNLSDSTAEDMLKQR